MWMVLEYVVNGFVGTKTSGLQRRSMCYRTTFVRELRAILYVKPYILSLLTLDIYTNTVVPFSVCILCFHHYMLYLLFCEVIESLVSLALLLSFVIVTL